jgi:hypothetical protein
MDARFSPLVGRIKMECSVHDLTKHDGLALLRELMIHFAPARDSDKYQKAYEVIMTIAKEQL